MSNSPADEERLDSDPTDELPILLETAVLDPEEHGVLLVADEEPTGEHTAHYPTLGAHERGANVDALKSDLEQRGAKIAALEQDIARLSARWLDVERHLNAKDTLIEELKAALASLRSVLDSRSAVERALDGRNRRAATRSSTRVAEELEQLERRAARDLTCELSEVAQRRELAAHERDRRTSSRDLEGVKAELAAASREPDRITPLREEARDADLVHREPARLVGRSRGARGGASRPHRRARTRSRPSHRTPTARRVARGARGRARRRRCASSSSRRAGAPRRSSAELERPARRPGAPSARPSRRSKRSSRTPERRPLRRAGAARRSAAQAPRGATLARQLRSETPSTRAALAAADEQHAAELAAATETAAARRLSAAAAARVDRRRSRSSRRR